MYANLNQRYSNGGRLNLTFQLFTDALDKLMGHHKHEDIGVLSALQYTGQSYLPG